MSTKKKKPEERFEETVRRLSETYTFGELSAALLRRIEGELSSGNLTRFTRVARDVLEDIVKAGPNAQAFGGTGERGGVK